MYRAETWALRLNEQKRLEVYEMWIWRRMERVKWTDKIKNAVVPERVGEGRTMVEKRKRNWLGHWLRGNCLLKDAGKREESSRQKKISGDRPHYAKWTV